MHNDEICSKYKEPVIPNEKGNCSLCGANLIKVISTYSQQQAIEDDVLVEVFKNRWNQLSGGRPILATSHLFNEVSLAALLEIWNEFVNWNQKIKDTLPEDLQMFVSTMNEKKVWVIEDEGQCYTMMYPDDY